MDTAKSIFGNNGQNCSASSRIFVHADVYEKYIDELKKIADAKIVGDPANSETTNGAIISKAQFDKVLAYIQSGKEEGARCVSGGERVGTKGYFVRPTVFADVRDDMKIAREEVRLYNATFTHSRFLIILVVD